MKKSKSFWDGGKEKGWVAAACLVVMLLFATGAEAANIKLGTATGGMMIYYNNMDVSGAGGGPDGVISGYDENPLNQAYIRSQFSYNNTDGMAFQFDNTNLGGFSWNSIFSGQPVGSSQFGFDFFAMAPTYNSGGGVIPPTPVFADNAISGQAGEGQFQVASPVAWAINDYKFNPPGAGGVIDNSLFRGTNSTFNVANLTVTGTVYTMTVNGWLNSDGFMHWYNPAQPHTDMTSWHMGDDLYFTGVLTYDKAGDSGEDQKDFYAGNIDIYVQISEPGVLLLLGSSMLGLALVGRKTRRQRV